MKFVERRVLRQKANNNRRQKRAEIDAHVEDRKPRVASLILVSGISWPTIALIFGLSRPVPMAIRTRPA